MASDAQNVRRNPVRSRISCKVWSMTALEFIDLAWSSCPVALVAQSIYVYYIYIHIYGKVYTCFFQAEGYDKLKRSDNSYYGSCFLNMLIDIVCVCVHICMSLYSLYSSSFTWINQDEFSRHENAPVLQNPQCNHHPSRRFDDETRRRHVQVFSAERTNRSDRGEKMKLSEASLRVSNVAAMDFKVELNG